MFNILSKIKAFSNRNIRENILDEIKAFKSIEGWLTDDEAIGLYSVAKQLKRNPVVVEIGSWKGKSTYCIAKGLQNGTLNCIDPFNADGEEGSKKIYEETKGEISLIDCFKANLINIPKAVKIQIHKGYSNEFINTIHSIDFLFIDGDHSIFGCQYDYENFWKDIKAGGFLAFHDYDEKREDLGPTWVIENIVKTNKVFSFYEKFDSLIVYKKNI